MDEVLKIGKFTIYVYSIGGYCVYCDGVKKRVYHSDTLWESVKYAEENLTDG